ncbi:MAG: glycosyltransferase [Pegethrix bostrychoides GSE-TBD4-15B]|jgi:glycosyltransferase involved in cell wall biosynthesis|uniref:Glycosyltransferase n=1 Tax=Pegethrix bostrychoides GSE-TBD4-15B TaxID=2839662 RepID=A0A951P8R5_9CYAN|nr:glycosyltransferase [Pegethrix bostrychoides GSE-TBD4-15B]
MKNTVFVSLNPDTHTLSGHYFFYDLNLKRACDDASMNFFSLCWSKTDVKNVEATEVFLPVFTDHSWTIGNQGPDGPDQDKINTFKRELIAGIELIKQKVSCDEIILYMYTGSLYHAEVISQLVLRSKNIRAVINLFWLPFYDVESRDFQNRWLTFIRMMGRSLKVCLTVTTIEMQKTLTQATGIRFEVSPHPSTTFPDYTFPKMQAEVLMKRPEAKSAFNVLFPGRVGHGQYGLEKGYLLMVDIIANLLNRSLPFSCQCTARQFVDVKRDDVDSALERIKHLVHFVDGELTDDSFIEMMKKSDVVILPYYRGSFSRRTSGLFTDAIYLGKPVVSLQGTWMGNRIEELSCGVVAETDEPEAFTNAILDVIQQYEFYERQAVTAASIWFQDNNWLSLHRSVVSSKETAFSLHEQRNFYSKYTFV